jgi:hypothetical protein
MYDAMWTSWNEVMMALYLIDGKEKSKKILIYES